MRVLMPGISWHNRERISSVDFQPVSYPPAGKTGKRTRLASAGDDHHVVIWDINPDMPNVAAEAGSATKAADKTCPPTCICDLSRHQNSVTVVRWSGDGRLLASGDLDSVVIVWHYVDSGESAPDIFGEGGEGDESPSAPSESWSQLRVLRGHLQDVTGLQFSTCSSYLVSCSMDSTAIVFDVNKGTKVKILGDHKGWVQGIAWDPMSKFILTIASDRVLRVYNSKGYKSVCKTSKCRLSVGCDPESGERREERLVRLFHDDSYKSYSRRLSFSPDGELVVVPSGVVEMEGEAKVEHCTYVFSRMDFAKPVLCLPSKEYSIAVRFSPVKYKLRHWPVEKKQEGSVDGGAQSKRKPWEENKTLFALPYRMVYAVATLNSVVLYDTQQEEPFARVSQIHYIGLTDLTWSADGDMLVVSSTDGFCSFITFRPGEIGDVYVDEEEKEKENMATNGTDDKGIDTQIPTAEEMDTSPPVPAVAT